MGKIKYHGKCIKCGTPLHRGQHKYCSYICHHANRKQVAESNRLRVCEICGNEFVMLGPSGRANKGEVKEGRFCSKKCYGKWLSSLRQHYPSCPVYFKQCAVCGKWFTARRKTTTHCSVDCEKIGYAPEHIKNRIGKTVICKECGKEYIYQYGMKKRGFCSRACSKAYNSRIAKATRRARKKDTQIERIDPIAVFDRDGWKCRICGKHTPRASRGTYKSNAPELDHIVPLALGGWHTWQNVQCACRSCNQKKGIKTIKKGEQLCLI